MFIEHVDIRQEKVSDVGFEHRSPSVLVFTRPIDISLLTERQSVQKS
jgi:hypothetical protein